MTLGEVLRTVRIANNLTQRQVADRLGISRVRVTNYEADRHDPEARRMPAYAAALGTTAPAIYRLWEELERKSTSTAAEAA